MNTNPRTMTAYENNAMEPRTVISLINNMTAPPGYVLAARTHSDRYREGIVLNIAYTVPDTDPGRAHLPEEERMVTLTPEFAICTATLSYPEEVFAEVLKHLTACFVHEARESLQTFDGWAPLHPHNADGSAAFGTTPEADMRFGVV